MNGLWAKRHSSGPHAEYLAQQVQGLTRRFISQLSLGFFALFVCTQVGLAQVNNYAPTEADRANLVAAIELEQPKERPPAGLTGITVPHHLLAADLIARGFWAASAGDYTRIILIAPDHFHRIPEGFATNPHLAETILGPVRADTKAIATLLSHSELFRQHPDLSLEHGVSALLPFIARFFPNAEVVPIVASTRSGQDVWDAALQHLEPLFEEKTLIIQSTDFSHFLPLGQAVLRDQQTLDHLATGDAAHTLNLWQPDHFDSRAAMYLQMKLQALRGSKHAVVANRSSADYGGTPSEVTSYMAVLWHPDPMALSKFDYPDQNRLFLAGDTLLGRRFVPHLTNANTLALLLNTVLNATQSAPILLNLEGVLLGETLSNARKGSHVMTQAHAAPVLRNLNVVAASIANNHSWDFGAPGRTETARTLSELGITMLEHGQVIQLQDLSIMAINMLQGRDPHTTPEAFEELLCAVDATAPLVGFVHWGQEYTHVPSETEFALADAARRCGFTALVGAHSHQASKQVNLSASGLPFVFSLGNFFFDQSAERSSGAVVEIRRFDHGTAALRLVPLPHLFQLGFNAKPTKATLP